MYIIIITRGGCRHSTAVGAMYISSSHAGNVDAVMLFGAMYISPINAIMLFAARSMSSSREGDVDTEMRFHAIYISS
jgi:hypothetical protein